MAPKHVRCHVVFEVVSQLRNNVSSSIRQVRLPPANLVQCFAPPATPSHRETDAFLLLERALFTGLVKGGVTG